MLSASVGFGRDIQRLLSQYSNDTKTQCERYGFVKIAMARSLQQWHASVAQCSKMLVSYAARNSWITFAGEKYSFKRLNLSLALIVTSVSSIVER